MDPVISTYLTTKRRSIRRIWGDGPFSTRTSRTIPSTSARARFGTRLSPIADVGTEILLRNGGLSTGNRFRMMCLGLVVGGIFSSREVKHCARVSGEGFLRRSDTCEEGGNQHWMSMKTRAFDRALVSSCAVTAASFIGHFPSCSSEHQADALICSRMIRHELVPRMDSPRAEHLPCSSISDSLLEENGMRTRRMFGPIGRVTEANWTGQLMRIRPSPALYSSRHRPRPGAEYRLKHGRRTATPLHE